MKKFLLGLSLIASPAMAEPVWQRVDSEMTKPEVEAIYGKTDWIEEGDGRASVMFRNTGKKVSGVVVKFYGPSKETVEAGLTAKYGEPLKKDARREEDRGPADILNNSGTNVELVEWQKGAVHITLEYAWGKRNYLWVRYDVADKAAVLPL